MRKPDESLDDFVVRALEINTEPPRPVSLRLTGEVEVLKPLAVWEPPVKSRLAPSIGLSWFHRSLVAGGAFAVGAIVLGSAIFIGMYDAAVRQVEGPTEVAEIAGLSDTSAADQSVDTSPSADDLAADIFTTPSSDTTSVAATLAIHGRAKRSFRPNRYSAARSRRSAVKKFRQTQPVEPFVPTTLIIYVDKGEVKSRIEPQLTASLNRTPTFSN